MELIVKWRPYQEDYFKAIELAKERKVKRQLIVMATGTGKRLLAVGTSAKYKSTLFLCHREELIEQAYVDFEKAYPLQVGIIKGKRFDIDKKIVIASAQTIWRRLDKIPKDRFDCVMADEVHHYLAKTYIMPLNHFEPENMFGYTATPTRLDGLDFSNIVDEITFEYPIEKGIRDGFLSELEAYRVKTDLDISKVKRVGGDFNKKDLSNKVDIPARNMLIVTKYIQYGAQRQGMVFCASIKHAERVRDMFREYGITSEALSSATDKEERRLLIQKFKMGKFKIFTNVNILTEGFDYADIGCIMMARPTMSLSLYMQMLGRGTRLKTQEYITKFLRNDCTILDFVDNSGELSLVNHWTIEKGKEIEDRVLISEEQRDIYKKKIDKVRAERAAKIRRMYNKDKEVILFVVPTRKKVMQKGRMLEPATEKQLDWLKRANIWQKDVEYTKGQASQYISNLAATRKMIRDMNEWGFDTFNKSISVGQYYDAKREYQEKIKERIEALNNY